MRYFIAFLIGLAMIVAANAQTPVVHADPIDTVGVQANLVCATLHEEPSVWTLEHEINRLLATYTEESEHKVMYAVMHTYCPQYQYLAFQALQDELNSGQIQQGSVV